jgi:hypothetical protein
LELRAFPVTVIGTDTDWLSTVAWTPSVPDWKDVNVVPANPALVEAWEGFTPPPEITANETGIPSGTAFPGV